MREPLFIFLSLLSFWMFDLYFERDHHWLWIVACGTFVGMAYLTRYSGLALVATCVVALLILHKSWKQRLRGVGLFLESVLPWVLCWSIRNRLAAGNTTNRTFVWHPLTADNVNPGLRVFSDFFLPVGSWQQVVLKQVGVIEVMIILVLGAVLVWVAVTAWKYVLTPQQVEGKQKPKEVISFTTGLYIFAYLASIVASMLMFDAATKFKLRILAPVLVSLLILLVAFGVWLWSRQREVVIISTLLLIGVSIYKDAVTIPARSEEHTSELQSRLHLVC